MPQRLRINSGGLVEGIRFIPSPNCDNRPAGCTVDLLVIHYISLPPGKFGGPGVMELFTNRLDPAAHPDYAGLAGLRVSSHFLVRRDGGVIQFVPCGKRAWHAGESSWKGRTRCNDFSIGIEVEGTGDAPFTGAQYRRLAALTRELKTRYAIRDIVGHSDVAPGRKSDPGPFFDWARYRRMLEVSRQGAKTPRKSRQEAEPQRTQRTRRAQRTQRKKRNRTAKSPRRRVRATRK